MKTFYRKTIALCLSLALLFLIAGTAAAVDAIEIRGPFVDVEESIEEGETYYEIILDEGTFDVGEGPSAKITYKLLNDGVSIDFYDNSELATAWYWDFGDGTYSTEQNPIHRYSPCESYEVKLTVSNEYDTDSTTITLFVPPLAAA